MGVSSGRSRVADLAFQVFNRALHPEWFTTRAFKRVAQRDWEVDLRIIEGGHAILFRSGSVRLCETLTGIETILPEPGPLFRSRLRHEQSTSLRPGGPIIYQSCFAVERVDPEIFQHLCEELNMTSSRSQLCHRFAAPNRMSPEPISQIHIDSRFNDISIQSFHTFPEEYAFVRTQSLFELRATASRH